MNFKKSLLCAGIVFSTICLCPLNVFADSMDDYSAYNYMKKEDKEKLERIGLTKYQKQQIEQICGKLGIDSEQYIKDNYYGLLIGIKQSELEKQFVASQGYENGTELVTIDDTEYALSHDYKYDYATDSIIDNTMYFSDLGDSYDASSEDGEGFVNHYLEWESTPAFDWAESSHFHKIDESSHIMRVYVDGVQDAAAAMAIASGETSFMLQDVSKEGEISTTYYGDGEPLYVQKSGDAYLNEYGTVGTKYFDLEGNELSTAQFKDAFDTYYASLGEENKILVNSEKQQNACHIRSILANLGGDDAALKEEYEEVLANIDNVSGGELWDKVVELNQLQREIKEQRGAVMEEATHYFKGDIDIDPQFAKVDTDYADEVQKYIQQYVNEYRASKGLGEVEISSNVLGTFADTRATELCYLYDCYHRRPDESALSLSSVQVSENCAALTGDRSAEQLARAAVNGWIKSYGHEKNLVNENHKTMNIGVSAKYVDGKIVYYIAQDFSSLVPSDFDELYADADTSVIEPKVKAAKGETTYTDDEGKEHINVAGSDNSGFWTHPIVGDVIEIDGKIPNRITTCLNGNPDGGYYNVIMYDSNDSFVCMTTLFSPDGPPEYVSSPYVYIGFYNINAGGSGSFVPVGSSSQSVSGNISNYWSSGSAAEGYYTGGNWDLINKYSGGW